jgi:WD40 repeat protein
LAAGVAASIGRPGSDIQILELESGKLVRTLVGHTWMVTSVDVSPDGKLLASGAWDGTARIWDTQTGNSLATLTFPEPKKNGGVKQTAEELEEESFEEEIANHVHSVEFSPNGRMLSVAAGGGILSKSGGKIGLWDVATSKLKSTFKLEDSSVQQVLFSPNGNVILTAGADGLTKLWDAVSFKEVGKAEGCYPVAFSPDGKTIAATLDYRTVLVRKRSDPK